MSEVITRAHMKSLFSNTSLRDSKDFVNVATVCIANAYRDGPKAASQNPGILETRIKAFLKKTNPDVIVFTEMHREFSDELKKSITRMMNALGYCLTGEFLKNDQNERAFATQMWHSVDLTLVGEPRIHQIFYIEPNKFREYALRNGTVVATFSRNDQMYNIGAIHSSLLLHGGQTHMFPIMRAELKHMLTKAVKHDVKWCGDLNLTDGFLTWIHENYSELMPIIKKHMPFVGFDQPDFINSPKDRLPESVGLFYGDMNALETTTLGQAAGLGINLNDMIEPFGLTSILGWTRAQIAEKKKEWDFVGFDHALGLVDINPSLEQNDDSIVQVIQLIESILGKSKIL